jgi:hypothetical protein
MSVSWTLLKNLPGRSASAMWLMQDGSVLANLYGEAQLMSLRPDEKGSYVSGSWTASGNFLMAKTFFASAVLSDGRLVTAGGEFVGLNAASEAQQDESNFCEIFDMFTDRLPTSVQVASPPGWPNIGDAPSVVLNDGTWMIGNSSQGLNNHVALLNPSTLTWTFGIGDGYQEETWTLLQTGDVITWACNSLTSMRYDALVNSFIPDQNLPAFLGAQNNLETGPGITLMDGRVICFGGSGQTCIYTPGLQGSNGTWVQGPNLPINPVNGDQLIAADVGAILEPNGKVFLLAAGLNTASAFVEYDPALNAFGPILTDTPVVSARDVTRMLLLPDGHGLISIALSGDYYDLTFSKGGDASWAPTITSFPATVKTGSTVTLSGTQLCGLSECQSFGDDNQQAENYPLVRFVNKESGEVTYARAHDVSTRSIAPGKAGTVLVDIPNLNAGAYSVHVVAMGIPSAAVTVNVAPDSALLHSPLQSTLQKGVIIGDEIIPGDAKGPPTTIDRSSQKIK